MVKKTTILVPNSTIIMLKEYFNKHTIHSQCTDPFHRKAKGFVTQQGRISNAIESFISFLPSSVIISFCNNYCFKPISFRMSYFYLNKSVNQASAVASAALYGKDFIITASGSVLRQFKYQLPGGSLEQTGEHVLSRHVLYIHCYGSNLYVLYKDFSMELLSIKDAFKVV